MSELKVNKISPRSGTAITLGDSGDTFTIPSGATLAIAGSVTGFTSAGIDDNATSVAITINSSEQVGIGTTSPDHLLHISASSTNAQLKLQRTGSATASYNISASSDGLAFSNQVAGSEVMRITSTGLGIGTSSPTSLLSLEANSPDIMFTDTSGGTDSKKWRVFGLDSDFRIGCRNDANSSGQTAYEIIRSSATIDSHRFSTDGSERMRINSSGNVGIGIAPSTASASGATIKGLVIGDNNATGVFTGLQILNRVENSTTSNGIAIDFDHKVSGSTTIPLARVIAKPSSSTSGNLQFYTSTSSSLAERMRINSSGQVGIGTSSPEQKLDVNGIAQIQTATSGTRRLRIKDSVTSQYFDIGVAISSSQPNLTFSDGADERMRIDSSGNVGIGTTSPSLKLDVSGDIKSSGITNRTSLQGVGPTPVDANSYELANGYLNLYRDDTATVKQILFGKNGSEVGSISTTGSATSFNTSSDYRLKENVIEMTNATDRLKQLQPKRFNFISDTDTTVDGFLAHEVSNIVPEAVIGTHNGIKTWTKYDELPDGVSIGDNKLDENGNTIPEYQGIDQAKLVPLLVKTIQELEARITTLEANNP